MNLGAGVPPVHGELRGSPLRGDAGNKPVSSGGTAGASSFLKRAKEARDGGTQMCQGSVDTAEDQHPSPRDRPESQGQSWTGQDGV